MSQLILRGILRDMTRDAAFIIGAVLLVSRVHIGTDMYETISFGLCLSSWVHLRLRKNTRATPKENEEDEHEENLGI